jgi:hypothetical protein
MSAEHGFTRFRRRVLALALSLALAPATALAAGGGKPAKKLVHVADTRGLEGLTRWVADVYNESYWLYALAVVGIMTAMGVILGWGCDRLMGLLGIDLGRMQHHE